LLIPFADENSPDRIFPWVNISFILISIAVFLYQLSLGAGGTDHLNRFIVDYGLVPCEYTNHCSPYVGTPSPVFVTLFTSMFMHGGWAHIFFNMLFLWVFGDNIENSMGHFRYLFFYLICGLGANGLEIATATTSSLPGLGASGAIAGILGAYLMLFPTSRVSAILPIGFIPIPVRLPAWILIGFWFVVQLLDGYVTLSNAASQSTGGVAYWAHVGGFITGAVLIWLFRHPPRVQSLKNYYAGPAGG
jgi:membrane associated rhomboid family serine protease